MIPRQEESKTGNRIKILTIIFVLFTTGIAASGFEIISCFLFSFLYGYTLKYFGVFLAAFMFATAAGAFLGGYWKKESPVFQLYICEFIFIVLSLCFYFLPQGMSAIPNNAYPSIFFCLNLMLGFVTGLEFLILCCLYHSIKSEKSNAGFLYSVQNFGFSLIAAVFIYTIPLPGLKISTLIILSAKLISFISLFTLWKFQPHRTKV
ncbi:MAG: hypothetical protein A2161_00765 [Candidatus Schekmanbacteria bacterium RBG_13_48_7]|uniref:Major facilitator superfamily (MFS) profile domain-containing protein n=1 Tax=Candidatus Schekmanbacteria bacterium RBG_13_48_7 TaxID=1817878 RepID=A0A1F7RUN9_9BACT|nr:MAG: hypothetical protein A2161_00765 [Candidatus Schekmanbacteria bacterium RBG_13_48_7]